MIPQSNGQEKGRRALIGLRGDYPALWPTGSLAFRAAVRCLTLWGAGVVFALAGTVLVDELVEPGTKQGHKGPTGPGPVKGIGLRK